MPSKTIRQALEARGLLAHIALPTAIDELLSALTSATAIPEGDDVKGVVSLAESRSLGFLALDLAPIPIPVAFRLISDAVANEFRFWLDLTSIAPADKIFTFIKGTPGIVLKAAKPDPTAAAENEERLVDAGGEATIGGVTGALLVEGKAAQTATMRLSPTIGAPAGIVAVRLVPPTVLIGGTGFGLELPGTDDAPGAFVIDDSAEAAPPGQTMLDGVAVTTRSDTPSWRGIAVRHARFYLPSGTPFLGGHAVDAFVEVGMSPGEGIDLAISTHVPPKGSRPGIAVRIECRDPAATGLQDFVPTLVEAAMELPLDGTHEDSPGGGFTMLAGKPVIARLRFVRSVADPETRLTLAVESQGAAGVLAVVAPGGGIAARVVITAAALATALVANKPPDAADASGVALNVILSAALGLSSCLKDKGRFTIHKVELSSTGHGLPLGDRVTLLIDYSVDVLVKPIDVGVLSVQMRDEQPMRVRNRNVALRINLKKPAASNVETVELDFSRADMEIEDPGSWILKSPGSIFDILGTRSGRGSTWLEVDLRFKLNLGPIRVSGATIRATLNDDGTIDASLRGLDLNLEVPGVIKGGGALALLADGGFSAALDIRIFPLNLATGGTILYKEEGGSFLLFVQISVDLPGPIPLANTGLGIYGISGAFGYNARPAPPPANDPDPVGYQLRWDPSEADAFEFRADNITVGAQAVIGTVADLGFSFSARAGLFVTVPDIVVRASMWGTVLSPRMGVADKPSPGGSPGITLLGVAVVDPEDAVTIGLKGELNIPQADAGVVLMRIVIPLGARFPTKGATDDWFIYLGSDGYSGQGRALGPMRSEVLPGLISTRADAYLMTRGHGIEKWPRGGPISVADGLVVAFGFGFQYSIGLEPIAWAEVHAGADILVATHPLTLAGFGSAGGSLHLGPFSVGVDAMLSLLLVENADPSIHARLCGHIDLFFTEIEGCVEMSINSPPPLDLPPPDVHPLDDLVNGQIAGNLAFLIDDKYRRIDSLEIDPAKAHVVWPDTLLHLSFAIAPNPAPGYVVKSGAGPQFSGIDTYPTGIAAKRVGSDMLKYEWSLTNLALFDVTGDVKGLGTLVPGPLSAAWQAGKDGDTGTRPQAGDLVLLTYHDDLYLHRLADSGAGLASDPLKNAATACQREVSASAGWAVGFIASAVGVGFLLPTDPISPDRCVSQFTATLMARTSLLPELVLGMHTAAHLPPGYDFAPASLEVFTPPVAVERRFSGALKLGSVSGPPQQLPLLKRAPVIQSALLVPSEPLTSARIWLIVDGRIVPGQAPLLAVVDDLGNAWADTDHVPLPSGRTALRFAPRGAGWIASVEVRWPVGTHLSILGLGGKTQAAIAAAAARNGAVQAEAARQAAAAAKQPQQAGDTTGAGVHAVLQPGRTYRLDVGMTWEGWMYRQDEDGSKQLVKNLPNNTTYLPKGADKADPPSTSRSYFFKTAPKTAVGHVGAVNMLSRYGEPEYVKSLHVRRDFFHPEMLTRFLLGYTPSQSETARFCDDPLDVHFSAAHVITLAKVYGYTLKLGLRRVDVQGDAGNLNELVPLWSALSAPGLLTGLDQRRMEVAVSALCAMPKPGATATAKLPEPLAPQSWYEVFTLAKSDDPANVIDGQLAGVTFKTSRWRNPSEMLAALRFTAGGAAASGDIELRQMAPLALAAIDGSDADFEAALDAIGLDGWPPVQEPRTSLLWLRQDNAGGPSWLCAGTLLESPEPIDRPGRVHLSGLSLVMSPLQAGVFDIRRSDRARSRLLWVCSTPFAPRSWLVRKLFQPPRRVFPSLTLTLADDVTKALLSGSLKLPLTPSFAEEA